MAEPNDPALRPSAAEFAARARGLLRGARVATLATAREGEPYAALVTPAVMGDLSVVLLLSDLSEHTRRLAANPLCSLLCMEPPGPATALANPQSLARVSLLCRAAPDDAPALRARYLALHPYAAPYAGFRDFRVWRLGIERGQFVGGFAQAWSFSAAALAGSAQGGAVIGSAEAAVLHHCNTDHAAAMDAIGVAHGGSGDGFRLVAVDEDGGDLISASSRVRVDWPCPVGTVSALRAAIVRLAQEARKGASTEIGSR